MMVLLWILAATVINGAIALVGGFSLLIKEKTLRKLLMVLVAFAAGAMLGGSFLHVLAESLESLSATTAFSFVLFGFVVFFLVERLLHWHHCHDGKCETHPYTHMLLFGDGIHNFIDGLVIAASFLVSVPFGIVTTVLIILHEIPQELGDFGVLLYGGLSRRKALSYNFLSQLTSVIGGVVGFLLAGVENFSLLLLPFAAGGFLYIAASDLIPELHKETGFGRSMIYFVFLVMGIAFMMATKLLLGG